MQRDVIVIGAGVAGLSLARQLHRRGREVTVLERSRGVGGRCATRRVDGVRVDHGVPLIHGRTEAFSKVLDELDPGDVLPGWPARVRGAGTPCQPQAYDARSVRVALGSGVSGFARHLARDLDVQRETQVTHITRDGSALRVEAGDEKWQARTVVVAAPPPQGVGLLEGLEGDGDLAAVKTLLGRVVALPCLTVLAGYERVVDGTFDLVLPGPHSPIHSLIHDSSKRGAARGQVLVIQAAPGWSRDRLERDEKAWTQELLRATADELGREALDPSWVQAHVWEHARVQGGDEMSHPVLVRLEGGATVGLCGDTFHPSGGVEGAYLSGRELASRILTETEQKTDQGG